METTDFKDRTLKCPTLICQTLCGTLNICAKLNSTPSEAPQREESEKEQTEWSGGNQEAINQEFNKKSQERIGGQPH